MQHLPAVFSYEIQSYDAMCDLRRQQHNSCCCACLQVSAPLMVGQIGQTAKRAVNRCNCALQALCP